MRDFKLERSDNPTIGEIKPEVLVKEVSSIPISVNEKSFTEVLTTEIDGNNVITKINLVLGNKQVNFLSLIKDKSKFFKYKHKDFVSDFTGDNKFYLIRE